MQSVTILELYFETAKEPKLLIWILIVYLVFLVELK